MAVRETAAEDRRMAVRNMFAACWSKEEKIDGTSRRAIDAAWSGGDVAIEEGWRGG